MIEKCSCADKKNSNCGREMLPADLRLKGEDKNDEIWTAHSNL